MLPLPQRIAFLVFASVAVLWGAKGFYRVSLRIRRGRPDAEPRHDRPWRRLWYAAKTTVTQARTFRRRPAVSVFHSFIVYGFAFYLLVNLMDGLGGYLPFTIPSTAPVGAMYNLCADILSFLVLLGVVALVARRWLTRSRHDFDFNPKTPLHEKVREGYIPFDSAIVSAFILFHVGSRAAGQAAKLRLEGGDRFQPFATLLSRLLPPAHLEGIAQFGYWGALGSVLLFLAYFPWSKHLHLLMTPLKYFFAREAGSGVLPALNMESFADGIDGPGSAADLELEQIGARRLEDLSWPRLLDAYACIQCNRCQDVCPATATGKALSPAALEINKRMELNELAKTDANPAMQSSSFERGAPSPRPLLEFALSPEALWACTTCGACMEVCPVENEQMLDILDIRRNEGMTAGRFPAQLQTAFRGMERASNPWGISRDQRLAWAEGLSVKTVEENPDPEVLFWVGCSASYDPQAQRTARAFVQLLNHAEVNFAVLGKREGCTGDSARRAGNEYLYSQLAQQNVATLKDVKPKRIVATCPHCMNTIGNEYRQVGGDFQVMHHTQYLEELVAAGRLQPERLAATVTYHDPCYLGRHNGVYDAPRNLLRGVAEKFVELDRRRENSFCCGAGGAQFWKEEEPGRERISDNRFREARERLGSEQESRVLAVGCPFCKSMLSSTPGRGDDLPIEVKDVAELLLESVERRMGGTAAAVGPDADRASHALKPAAASEVPERKAAPGRLPSAQESAPPSQPIAPAPGAVRTSVQEAAQNPRQNPPEGSAPEPARKKWQPGKSGEVESGQQPGHASESPTPDAPAGRRPWKPKS
ncbi:MAG TPA: heterodisulfide reductase-related iron-sulfur binding cluster [Acidobacteriaceae bacterium]|nr:heterodisulfide reductase-related iron-sulfur binding cluster [Acidobacteriaceae bacterium]